MIIMIIFMMKTIVIAPNIYDCIGNAMIWRDGNNGKFTVYTMATMVILLCTMINDGNENDMTGWQEGARNQNATANIHQRHKLSCCCC